VDLSLPPGNEAEVRRPPGRLLPRAFYDRDARELARDLLGKLLCRRGPEGGHAVGRIVEVEAYVGEGDPACHAAAGLTPRTRILYGPPGRAYVYFTYGMHHCVNVVAGPGTFPAAVLVRALRPVRGTAAMMGRRGTGDLRLLTTGPGRLCQALAIDLAQNGISLRGPELQIRDDGVRPARVRSGPRVGIRVAVDRPWRYWAAGDPFVSRAPAPPRDTPAAGRRLRSS
jgi:DNA-3-methyladenine glycosylase